MLYREFSLQGIVFADLILLPAVLAINFLIVCFSAKGMQLSWTFFSLIRDRSARGVEIRPVCILLLGKCIKCMLLIGIISIVEALLSVGFIGYFNLQ